MGGALIKADVIFERDLAVPMRDGVVLSANLFRPADGKRVPVVMSVTPYGKDRHRDRLITFFMRMTGVRFGKIKVSRFTGFEAPDPLYWARNGYAVMQTDVRGMHKSQGHAGVLTDRDAEDYYDVIEWAATPAWCDGGVGLSGVSYRAMSQWRVAALRPPHLKAIIPWEAVSDLYREMVFHGGIPETGFVPTWWKKRMMPGRNKQFDFAEDFLAEIDRHPLEDSYWRGKQTALERINAPALVCASWSDQGLIGDFEQRLDFVGDIEGCDLTELKHTLIDCFETFEHYDKSEVIEEVRQFIRERGYYPSESKVTDELEQQLSYKAAVKRSIDMQYRVVERKG